MKRKVVMVSLAMLTGLPHAAYAKSGIEGGLAQTYSSWNTSYMPHYGVEGAAKPLMDHVSVGGAPGQDISNTWRLEFAPPTTVSGADAPLAAKDKRVGFSLKLDF